MYPNGCVVSVGLCVCMIPKREREKKLIHFALHTCDTQTTRKPLYWFARLKTRMREKRAQTFGSDFSWSIIIVVASRRLCLMCLCVSVIFTKRNNPLQILSCDQSNCRCCIFEGFLVDLLLFCIGLRWLGCCCCRLLCRWWSCHRSITFIASRIRDLFCWWFFVAVLFFLRPSSSQRRLLIAYHYYYHHPVRNVLLSEESYP